MGLYLVRTPDIKTRRAESVFFFHNGAVSLLERNLVSRPYFEASPSDIDSYKQIIDLASKHNLGAYEILVEDTAPLKSLLEFLSDYLLDKDVSVGLLIQGYDQMPNAESIANEYGVTVGLYHANIEARYNDILEIRYSKELTDTPILRKSVQSSGVKKNKVTKSKPRMEPIVYSCAAIELEESFHEKFIKLLIESGKDNAEIYKKAGVTRQVFSKIISDKDMIPTKLTLVSLCIGLELPYRQSKELINTAGYSLSKSIMFDSIVIKYLKDEIFDLDLINSELNEYGCQLLGWHPREK